MTDQLNEFPESVLPQVDEEDVERKRLLKTIENGEEIMALERNSWEQILDEHDDGLSTEGPVGARYMKSKESFNLTEKVRERMEPLRFSLEFVKDEEKRDELQQLIGTSAKEGNQEAAQKYLEELKTSEELARIQKAIVEAGVTYTMKKGGWFKVLESTDGAYDQVCKIGNSFILMEKGDGASEPIVFRTHPPDRVYIWKGSAMRNAPNGKDVRRIVLVFDYDYDEYISEVVERMPVGKRKKAMIPEEEWGDLPQPQSNRRSMEDTPQQDGQKQQDDNKMGQMAIFIDLDAKTVLKSVGKKAREIDRLEGGDFPYYLMSVDERTEYVKLLASEDKKALNEFLKTLKCYAPVIHLTAYPKRGFYKGGVGHYASEIKQVDEVFKSKIISGSIKEIDPIDIIDVPEGKQLDVQAKVIDAERDNAEGYRAVVYNEMDDQGRKMLGTLQKLSGGSPDGGAITAISNVLEKDKIEMGINMRDVSTDASKTATAITEESNATAMIVKRINKRMSPEHQFAIEMTIQHLILYVDEDNSTVIPTSGVKVGDPENGTPISGVTLGDVVTILKKKGEVLVNMDDQSGIIPSPLVEFNKINAAYPLVQGTLAGQKIAQKALQSLGWSLPISDFSLPQPPQQPENVPTGQPV